jgi:amino acid transporter
MAVFLRRLGRWDLVRVAASVFGLAWLGLLGAFGYAATLQQATTPALLAAAAALLIAAAGILYAWRDPHR